MSNSLKLKSPLQDNTSFNKNINASLKSLDHIKRVKELFEFCQKSLISKSTRNISKKQDKSNRSPCYFKKNLPSVQNRLKNHKNKQNIKFPQITKPIQVVSSQKQKPLKKTKIRNKSGKPLKTEPICYNFATVDQVGQRKTDIKDALMQILNSESRKSITLQEDINRLHELTKMSGSLRRHLRSIQEDMFSINLKKKLSKLSIPNSSFI